MAVRTALLTSKNINLDTDFSKYIETVSEPGVITGFAVTSSSVATGQARVPCERTNGETIYAFVQNFNSVSISGDGYVIISIPQNIIDNGGGNEDGTGIATIEVVNELPAKNYLLLATITSGDVEDNRNMIPKVGELKTDIDSIFASIEDLDERVDALEAAGAIDHLEEMALVGELYTLNDTLFKQNTPTLANSSVEVNVGDVTANTEIHIQRQGSGTASNKLKLKVKMAGSATTNLKVEVRKGIQVTVTENVEAYWYGDEDNIIATGSAAYTSFSSDWTDVEFTLDANFGGTAGELLDVVVYQESSGTKVVNASNYYIIGCDSTQRSEAFSCVMVNGTTRTRSKLMPYCISTGFAQAMLCKTSNTTVLGYINGDLTVEDINASTGENGQRLDIFTNANSQALSFSLTGEFAMNTWSGGENGSYGYYIGETETQLGSGDRYTTFNTKTASGSIPSGSTFGLYWKPNNWRYPVTLKTKNVVVTINGNIAIEKREDKKEIPQSLKPIGQIITCYLFGRLPNGLWRDGN